MVYIYMKKVGGKSYYYLRASQRKENRVIVKDVAYLGSSLEEVKGALEKLPKYSEQIRKAYKTIHSFLESNRYIEKVKDLKLKRDSFLKDKLNEVEACKIHYNTIFIHNPYQTKQEIIKNFIVEFAFNTAAIEGNTIKLEEARNLLEEERTPKNKSVREIYDIQNSEKVFFKLLEEKHEINHDFIIRIHRELMENIDVRTGYRTTDVRVIKANFKATPAPYVKTDMQILIDWYEKHRKELHPIVLAVIFHHKFEKIHPFMDGNGRTGRVLMNYILIKNEYPPIIIYNKDRQAYLKALKKADTGELTKSVHEDYDDLVQFAADEAAKSYWNLFL